MAERRQTLRNLAKLLPSGAVGLSISLAGADASATAVSEPAKTPQSVKDHLESIRGDVSSALKQYAIDGAPFVAWIPRPTGLVGQWRLAQRRLAQRRMGQRWRQLGQRRLAQRLGQWRLAQLVSPAS